jgi:SAM-dependent methyltransferase
VSEATGLGVIGALLRVAPCRVVDVGGGTGVWAVPLAQAGCEVVVVDPSPNSLAALARRAAEAGVADRVSGVQGDVDTLLGPEPHAAVAGPGADLVLAHGVLEVVDDVAVALRALVGLLAPGGVLSVLVSCRAGTALQRALAGRLRDARQVLDDPDGRSGPSDVLLRRFDAAELEDLLAGAGLAVEAVRGDRVLADLLPATVREASSAGELAELEQTAAASPALAVVAGRLHALARRPAADG